MIKKYITDNCFTKTGGLNNRVTVKTWWDNRQQSYLYDEILKQTSFLGDTSTFSERIYCIMNGITQVPHCQVCAGNIVKFKSYSEGYYQYCSQYCATQSPERNSKISLNRDTHSIVNSMKETNLVKYGVPFTTMLPEFALKSKATKLSRYGDENYCNVEKSKNTNLQKYGYEWSAQVPSIINKIQDSKLVHYPQLKDPNWLLEQNKTKSITQISEELSCTYRTVCLYFDKYNITPNFFSPSYSTQQTEIQDFVSSVYTGQINTNDRTVIAPKELDIYLPDIKLAIEFNGMYWHREDRKRHLVKYNLCQDKGITLLQVWDHEWTNSKGIVQSIIKSKLGCTDNIYGRKCDIVKLSSTEYSGFLTENHMQGKVNSSIRYGLIHQGELVSVMGLGKSRYDKKCSHELLRFAVKLGKNVTGGFSKLLKHAITNEDIESIQTFADIRLFTGMVYEKYGFTFSHQTPPGYVYYKSGMVKNRQSCQKHKLRETLSNFDESLSESENMSNNGWFKVYDCGQRVYTLHS